MKYLWFYLLILSVQVHAQSLTKQFLGLSSPEKCWVVLHPFKAKKAFKISEEVLVIVDSIAKTDIIGRDLNGGNLDAFKHSFWIVNMTGAIGGRAALKLGKAYEKGNYKTHTKK